MTFARIDRERREAIAHEVDLCYRQRREQLRTAGEEAERPPAARRRGRRF